MKITIFFLLIIVDLLLFAIYKTYRKHVPYVPYNKNNPQTVHELKLLKKFAFDVAHSYKRFEFRLNDRNYQIGDLIHFSVVDDDLSPVVYKKLQKQYFLITSVLDNKSILGLDNTLDIRNYVILSIQPVDYFPPKS